MLHAVVLSGLRVHPPLRIIVVTMRISGISFSLVDSYGGAVRPGVLGILIADGGTVCDDDFSDNSADAICRKMGYDGHMQWRNGHVFDIQSSYEIKLDDVKCSAGDWTSCTYSSSHNCNHNEDVLLQCYSVVDGGWTDFGDWSECSNPCADGVRTRQRTCTNPAPAHGGTDCVGEPKEIQGCDEYKDCSRYMWLVDHSGRALRARGRVHGLVIFETGTVCDTGLNAISATALCKFMGYSRNIDYSSGYKWSIQRDYNAVLDLHGCSADHITACDIYFGDHCHRTHDIFLTCE